MHAAGDVGIEHMVPQQEGNTGSVVSFGVGQNGGQQVLGSRAG